jgi:hypothetical protein
VGNHKREKSQSNRHNDARCENGRKRYAVIAERAHPEGSNAKADWIEGDYSTSHLARYR